MNAAQLTSQLAKRLNQSKVDIDTLIAKTTEIITEQLSADNIVSIHNFGTLELKEQGERINVNPATGQRTLIPPKRVVKYKVSPTLNDKIKES
ncbi:MAG: HU family DNA-binding protein [Dysgonamonadaceae bacterium]|jgi:DNA-binding protein HU-beta|nr:HU family DNA-binding protein [Dysgonamonadaceae bacterium]